MTENSHFANTPEIFDRLLPITPEEKLVTDVYASVDEASMRALEELCGKEGIIASCKLGCCHCCRFFILINVAEAHTLAQYIRRTFTADRIEELRMRTRQWHEWEHSRPESHPSSGLAQQSDFLGYEHSCPLLSNGICSVYPVRPVVCRTHFVSSNPLSCFAANDPKSKEDAPAVLMSVVTASSAFSKAIRDHIEKAGMDFSRSLMLLPHWLAIEMGWDFALSP